MTTCPNCGKEQRLTVENGNVVLNCKQCPHREIISAKGATWVIFRRVPLPDKLRIVTMTHDMAENIRAFPSVGKPSEIIPTGLHNGDDPIYLVQHPAIGKEVAPDVKEIVLAHHRRHGIDIRHMIQ